MTAKEEHSPNWANHQIMSESSWGKRVTLQSQGSVEEPKGVLPMEGTNEVQGNRKRTRPPRGAARRVRGPHPHFHPFEVRRKAVQLCLEESFPLQRVAREMGVGLSTLSKWVRAYREQGEAGL